MRLVGTYLLLRARATPLLLWLVALVTLTTAVISGTTGLSASVANVAARAALTEGMPMEGAVQVRTRLAKDPTGQDELARRQIDATFAPVPVSIGRLVVTEPQPATHDGQALGADLVLLGGPELAPADTPPADLVTLVEGSWPRGGGDGSTQAPAEAALHAGAARAWGLAPGDVVVVSDRALLITGIWQPRDAQDAFWFGDELVRTGVSSQGSIAGPAIVDEALAQSVGTPFVRWPVRLESDRVTPDDLPILAAGAATLRAELRRVDGLTVRGVLVDGDLAPTAARAATNLATARSLVVVPLGVLVLVSALAMLQFARLLAAARMPLSLVLVARGASRAQVLGADLVELGVAAGFGSALGTALAWVALRPVPGSQGVGLAVVIAGVATFLGVGAVLSTVASLHARRWADGRSADDRSGRARAATASATVILVLGAAAVSWWQLRSNGSPLIPAADGTPGTDYLAGAAPALLLAAAALLALALLGPVSRAAEALTRGTRSSSAHLAWAQVSRRLAVYAVPVVLAVLATGSTTLAALYAGSSTQLRDDRAAVSHGAPVRADLVRPHVPNAPGAVPAVPPNLAVLPEVDAAAVVWLAPYARVGTIPVPMTLAATTGPGSLPEVVTAPAGIPAGLVPQGLDQPLDSAGLPMPSGGSAAVVPVAITRQVAAVADLVVGDAMAFTLVGDTVPARVVAVVEAVPGQRTDVAALADSRVVSLVLRQRQADLGWPTQVWARPAGSTDAAMKALSARADISSVIGAGGVSVTDATNAVRLVFWVCAVGAVLLALTGIAAVAAAELSSRRAEVAVLRALGMTPLAQARSRALEVFGVVGAALTFGLGAGWLVGWGVVPELAASTVEPGSLRLPAVLQAEPGPWVTLVAMTLLALTTLTALLAWRVRLQAVDRTYREEIR